MNQAAALLRVGDAGAVRDVGKDSVVISPKESAVVDPSRAVVAVGGNQIQVAVVVVVEKGRAPGPARVAHSGGFGDVGERAIAVVAVEAIPPAKWAGMIGVGGDVGDEPIQIAIAIVIAKSGSHAIQIGADAGGECAVGKRAVAVVPK